VATTTEAFHRGGVARRGRPGDRRSQPDDWQPLAEFPSGTAQEIDAAVTAARDAFDGGWRDAAPNLRRRLLNKLAQLSRTNAQELGRIATEDMGHAVGVHDGRGIFTADYVEYYAGWADKLAGETIPLSASNTLDYTIHERARGRRGGRAVERAAVARGCGARRRPSQRATRW